MEITIQKEELFEAFQREVNYLMEKVVREKDEPASALVPEAEADEMLIESLMETAWNNALTLFGRLAAKIAQKGKTKQTYEVEVGVPENLRPDFYLPMMKNRITDYLVAEMVKQWLKTTGLDQLTDGEQKAEKAANRLRSLSLWTGPYKGRRIDVML